MKKLSDFIAALEEAKRRHGDLELRIPTKIPHSPELDAVRVSGFHGVEDDDGSRYILICDTFNFAQIAKTNPDPEAWV
jgi:hypothetical protein